MFVDDEGRAYPDTLVGTDSPHPDGQRPRRARLGRRRHRGRGGHARPADLDAHARGRRLQADRRAARGLDRHRPRAHRHRAAAPPRRGRQVRRVLRPRRRQRAAREPGHDRQHVARVRVDVRHLPDRRRDAALPRASPAARPSWSPWSRPTPRSRACGTTRTAEPRFSETLELDLSHGRAQPGRADAAPGPGALDRAKPHVPGRPGRHGRRRRPEPGRNGPRRQPRRGLGRVVPGQRPAGGHGRARRRRRARPPSRPAGSGADPHRGRAAGQQPRAGRPGRRHQLRPRPRPRRHRRHHQLHQHVEPVGDARRRPAGPQGGRARAWPPSRG